MGRLSMLHNQIQRKGKFIESCESSTTSNEMVKEYAIVYHLNVTIYILPGRIGHKKFILLLHSPPTFPPQRSLTWNPGSAPVYNLKKGNYPLVSNKRKLLK
jgi:hypothetical protein